LCFLKLIPVVAVTLQALLGSLMPIAAPLLGLINLDQPAAIFAPWRLVFEIVQFD
jgi:hypothetical protein